MLGAEQTNSCGAPVCSPHHGDESVRNPEFSDVHGAEVVYGAGFGLGSGARRECRRGVGTEQVRECAVVVLAGTHLEQRTVATQNVADHGVQYSRLRGAAGHGVCLARARLQGGRGRRVRKRARYGG